MKLTILIFLALPVSAFAWLLIALAAVTARAIVNDRNADRDARQIGRQ